MLSHARWAWEQGSRCHPKIAHAVGWEAVYCIRQALSIVKVVYNVGDGVPNPHLAVRSCVVRREVCLTTAGDWPDEGGLRGEEDAVPASRRTASIVCRAFSEPPTHPTGTPVHVS